MALNQYTSTTLADPNAEELAGINRQQALANALMTQGLQGQPQGQMISGYYVKPSFAQALNPVAQQLAGSYLGKQADTKAQELAAAIRGKQAEAVQQYMQALNPQQTELAGPTPNGAPLQTVNQPNYNQAFAAATSPYAPAPLQAAGYEMLKPQKLGEGETLQRFNFNNGQFTPLASGGEKTAPELRTAAQLLGINKPVGEYTPQELAAIDAKVNQLKHAGASNTVVNMGQNGFENTLKLGENFKSEPIYKTHQEIRQAYNQVNNSLDRKDAAGDMAAAIKINKLLDPTSVVKESEAARIAASRGILDTIGQLNAKVTRGETLSPQQRTQYKSLVKDFYNISGQQYNETRNKYLQVGQQNELKGVDTMLGQPFVAPTSAMPPTTKNMVEANKILNIPQIGNSNNGNQ